MGKRKRIRLCGLVLLLMTGCDQGAAPSGDPCGSGYRACDNDYICVPSDRTCDEVDFPDLLSGVWIETAPDGVEHSFISLFYVNRDGYGSWHRSLDGGTTWEKLIIQWEFSEIQGTVDSVALIKITVLEGDPQLVSVEFQLQRKDGVPGFACDRLPHGLSPDMPCYLWCAPQIDCANDPTAPASLFVKCSADQTDADACGITSGITPLI